MYPPPMGGGLPPGPMQLNHLSPQQSYMHLSPPMQFMQQTPPPHQPQPQQMMYTPNVSVSPPYGTMGGGQPPLKQGDPLNLLAGASLGATLAEQLSHSYGTPGKVPYSQKIINEILKFGDSNWYPNFIDYTKLRQNIKRIVFLEQHPNEQITFGEQALGASAPPSFSTTNTPEHNSVGSSTSSTGVGDGSVTPLPVTSSSQKLRDIFWMLLGQEIDKVEQFYLRIEHELVQQMKSDLQLEVRLFESAEAQARIKHENEGYVPFLVQQWNTKKLQGQLSPTASAQPPPVDSAEWSTFVTSLYPSTTLSPQASLMFLQTLKEVHPQLWSQIAQNARTILPDLLSIIAYSPDNTVLDLLRHFLRGLLQIERLQKFGVINATIIAKLLKLYDFHTHRRTEKSYLAKLVTRPLFASKGLSDLVTYAQALIHEKLLPLKKPIGSSPHVAQRIQAIFSDTTCPICNQPPHFPVILRCQHRTCFACLAQQSSFGLLCPISNCSYHASKQKGTVGNVNGADASDPTLDPGDLQCEPVLSKLMAISHTIYQDSPQFQLIQQQQQQQQQHQFSPMNFSMGHSPQLPGLSSQIPSPNMMGMHSHSPAHTHISPGAPPIGSLPTTLSPMTGMMMSQQISPMQSAMHLTPPMQLMGGMHQPIMANMMGGPPMMQQQQHKPIVQATSIPYPSYAGPHGGVPVPHQSSTHTGMAGRPRSEGPKQSCHNCKTMRDLRLLLTCSSDPDTSRRRKCRKKFCAACIARLYGLHLERMSQEEKDKWICPTCLNVCVCAACKKKDIENGQPPVQLHPRTGLPLISPYADSPAYSADGTFPDDTPTSSSSPSPTPAHSNSDGLALLASSTQYNDGGGGRGPGSGGGGGAIVPTTVSSDPFSQFKDREDMMDESTTNHKATHDEVSALVSMSHAPSNAMSHSTSATSNLKVLGETRFNKCDSSNGGITRTDQTMIQVRINGSANPVSPTNTLYQANVLAVTNDNNQINSHSRPPSSTALPITPTPPIVLTGSVPVLATATGWYQTTASPLRTHSSSPGSSSTLSPSSTSSVASLLSPSATPITGQRTLSPSSPPPIHLAFQLPSSHPLFVDESILKEIANNPTISTLSPTPLEQPPTSESKHPLALSPPQVNRALLTNHHHAPSNNIRPPVGQSTPIRGQPVISSTPPPLTDLQRQAQQLQLQVQQLAAHLDTLQSRANHQQQLDTSSLIHSTMTPTRPPQEDPAARAQLVATQEQLMQLGQLFQQVQQQLLNKLEPPNSLSSHLDLLFQQQQQLQQQNILHRHQQQQQQFLERQNQQIQEQFQQYHHMGHPSTLQHQQQEDVNHAHNHVDQLPHQQQEPPQYLEVNESQPEPDLPPFESRHSFTVTSDTGEIVDPSSQLVSTMSGYDGPRPPLSPATSYSSFLRSPVFHPQPPANGLTSFGFLADDSRPNSLDRMASNVSMANGDLSRDLTRLSSSSFPSSALLTAPKSSDNMQMEETERMLSNEFARSMSVSRPPSDEALPVSRPMSGYEVAPDDYFRTDSTSGLPLTRSHSESVGSDSSWLQPPPQPAHLHTHALLTPTHLQQHQSPQLLSSPQPPFSPPSTSLQTTEIAPINE